MEWSDRIPWKRPVNQRLAMTTVSFSFFPSIFFFHVTTPFKSILTKYHPVWDLRLDSFRHKRTRLYIDIYPVTFIMGKWVDLLWQVTEISVWEWIWDIINSNFYTCLCLWSRSFKIYPIVTPVLTEQILRNITFIFPQNLLAEGRQYSNTHADDPYWYCTSQKCSGSLIKVFFGFTWYKFEEINPIFLNVMLFLLLYLSFVPFLARQSLC